MKRPPPGKAEAQDRCAYVLRADGTKSAHLFRGLGGPFRRRNGKLLGSG
jgi:hypothetical protein